MITQGLLLAAGKSTRLRALSQGVPKPIMPVAGKAIAAWNLSWLGREGLRDLWVNLHYRADEIRRALGDGTEHGVTLSYVEEDPILGTAGAWKNLASVWTGTSVVTYGDNLVRFDLARMYRQHRASGAVATIAVFHPDVSRHTGIAGGHVELDDEDRIVRFVEGGGSGWVNAGVYLLEPALLDSIGPGFQDFGRDVFPAAAAAGLMRAFRLDAQEFCLGLDTPEAYATACDLVTSHRVTLS